MQIERIEQGMIVAHKDHESPGVIVRAAKRGPLFVLYRGEEVARTARAIDLRPIEDIEIGTDLL